MTTDLKVLMRAESIIQRDAVMSALSAEGINAFAETRDISRKITDDTVDLAYEGYSAVFDGFTIQVNAVDFDRARAVAEGVLKRAQAVDRKMEEGSSLQRFYFCCLFSLFLPVVFHGLALYHLVRGLQRGEKPHPVYAAMSLVMFALTGVGAFYFLVTADLLEMLRSFADSL